MEYNGTMSSKGLDVLRKYEEGYWQTVAKARESLPSGVLPDFLASVQQVVIYDCENGYLILRYGEQTGDEFIITNASPIKWEELLHQQKLYDQYGNESTQRFTLKTKENVKTSGHIDIVQTSIEKENLVLRPKWLSATIVFGEPGEDLSDGSKAAKSDIASFY